MVQSGRDHRPRRFGHKYEAEFLAGNITQNVRDNCAADPRGLPPDYSGGAAIAATVFSGGGFGVLSAETSDTTTIGLIWQPQFADLSVSVDYFDIDLKNEVDQIGAAQIITSCYESNFGYAFGGIANAFDEKPPQLTRQGIGSNQYTMVGNAVLESQYDPLGRRFFISVTYNFD